MLNPRIQRIPKIVEKYDAEYQGDSVSSLAMTNLDLYEPQPARTSDSHHLLGLLQDIPYMAKSITDRQKRRLAKGRSFEEVWEEPTRLAAAFPA